MVTGALSVFAAARQAGELPAIVTEKGVWTWAQVAARVGRRLRYWSELPHGPRPGERWWWLQDSGVDGLWTVYGALELGICLVPLHGRWSATERAEFARRMGARGPFPIEGREPRAGDSEGSGVESATGDALPEPDEEALLAILATSGSTGRSKGVGLSRRAFLASAAAARLHLDGPGAAVADPEGSHRTLLSLPMAHVGGLSIVTRSLIARRTVVLPPPASSFDPATFLAQLERFRVTSVSLVPTMLHRLLQLGERAPAGLQTVLVGGAPASTSLMDRAMEKGWPVLGTYGLTEACSQVATETPWRRARANEPRIPGAVGPLLPGIEGRIVGGVLEIRGPTLMSGYQGEGAPVGSGPAEDGWFRTGDLARLVVGASDGREVLVIQGRADAVIISGGENISPLEVETALNEHPAVDEAVVLGVASEEWGQEVWAVVVRNVHTEGPEGPGTGPSDDDAWASELRSFVARNVARFKVPRRVHFRRDLPRTPSGKVDRRAVARELSSEPRVSGERDAV